MRLKQVVYLLLFIALPFLVCSQEKVNFDIAYQIKPVYPALSVSPQTLEAATTISDLNHFYKSDWVASFNSVEFSTTIDGKKVVVNSKDDTLTVEQKELIEKADFGAPIAVNVRYMPNNTLTNNDIQLFDFKFTVDPINAASYPGGMLKLNEYLTEKLINKVNPDHFRQYQLTAYKFTVNEEGLIENAHVFESSKNEKVDAQFLLAINKMACWTPASYSDGTKVKQDFVLTAGDHNSCIINLLNTRTGLVDEGDKE